MTRLLSLVALACALALGTAACGDDVISSAAAEVNGKEISQDALDAELDAIRGNARYLEFLQSQGAQVFGDGERAFNADFVRQILTRQIYLELVHQEARRQKLEVGEEQLDAVRGDVASEVGGPEILEAFDEAYQRTLLRRSAEVTALQQSLSDVEVDDAAIRAFYDENQGLFVQTCGRHILFAVVGPNGQVQTQQTEAQSGDLLAQATAAKARIDAGEDFTALAAELSKDQSNASDGGNLGCQMAGQFVPEFETAMDALQPGQVSGPVKTQFGYHLIKVDSREPAAFEEVSDQIRQQLLSQSSAGLGAFLSQALTDADVEINPRFGRFSRDLQQPGVLPPSTPTTEPVGASGQSGRPQSPIDLGG